MDLGLGVLAVLVGLDLAHLGLDLPVCALAPHAALVLALRLGALVQATALTRLGRRLLVDLVRHGLVVLLLGRLLVDVLLVVILALTLGLASIGQAVRGPH
eukprot:2874976-Alexandrium_andersonii.AAC.1